MTTRDKIINTALQLFSSLGYEKTTTKLIATEAKVNEVTIFRYFNNKPTLLKEVTKTYISGIEVNPELQEIFQGTIEEAITNLSKFVMEKFYDNEMMFKIQLKIEMDSFEKLKLSKYFIQRLEQYLDSNKIENSKAKAENFITIHLGYLLTYVSDLYTKEEIELQRELFTKSFIQTL